MSKEDYQRYMFPAPAGMNRIIIIRGIYTNNVPRTCGDEPKDEHFYHHL